MGVRDKNKMTEHFLRLEWENRIYLVALDHSQPRPLTYVTDNKPDRTSNNRTYN